MITPLFALLITLSSAGISVPLAIDGNFDAASNSFEPLKDPLSEEALQILEEYNVYRNTYPLRLTLNTTVTPDDEKIEQIPDVVSAIPDLSASEGYIITQNSTTEKPISITCTGTTTIDIKPEITIINCN